MLWETMDAKFGKRFLHPHLVDLPRVCCVEIVGMDEFLVSYIVISSFFLGNQYLEFICVFVCFIYLFG